MKCSLVILSFLVLACGSRANGKMDFSKELYCSSVVGLLKLLDAENQFVLNMTAYADALQDKLETLQVYLKIHDRSPHFTKKGMEKYVSNPLKAFALIRRLRQDWRELQVYTKMEAGKAHLQAMKSLLDKVPTEIDMQHSLLGINRIELTYGLKPMDLSEGRLQDKQFNNKLSIRDCLAIANHKFDIGDYARALIWYRIVLKRQPEPNFEAYNKLFGNPLDGVREKLAKTRLLEAMQIMDPSLSDKEAHERVNELMKASNATHLKSYVDELLKQDDAQLSMELSLLQPTPSAHYLGCRGQFPKRTNLSCRYNSTTTPFLRLAPLKMEEISHDPYIVMYHNVLSDSEIEEMKQQSKKMTNGLSAEYKQNQTEEPEIVGRVSWIVERTPFQSRINQRITDMTGFSLDGFAALQVANFGIGSYFKPHYDYEYGDRVQKDDRHDLGDRMASLIFYASEVPLGGATTFPDIQVAVPPQKGNSLFWYNLFDDGTKDPRSLHSVCPVILGSRWTLTKWIHIAPQMFRKPCTIPHQQLKE